MTKTTAPDLRTVGSGYEVIYADPPWRYARPVPGVDPEEQYKTMPLEDICALPVESIAAESSVLFQWATAPLLVEGPRSHEGMGICLRD